MRLNLPVTQREFDYPAEQMLVSTTDTKGFITHCNSAFVAVSGYVYDELIGQNHNLVRHPDMPAEAYKDLWRTVGQGRPWTGLVKNRRKNGDHYWVRANVTPIMHNGKPHGYMSVRTKPSRQEVQAADALYASMSDTAQTTRQTFYLQGGELRHKGLRGLVELRQRLTLTQRLGAALGLMALAGLFPLLFELHGSALLGVEFATLVAGGFGVLIWFHSSFGPALAAAGRFADDLAACNLSTFISCNYPPPLDALFRSLRQIQINLQAVVGDVRGEIDGIAQTAAEVAEGGLDLSARTESQAKNLEKTAASMEQLAGTVQHTADTAAQVATQSVRCTEVANQGGSAVQRVGQAMQLIEASSTKVRDIIGVIESIAFQTNILALNAAVEAARAAEHGRGFAVVASEVRLLAQRSAQAAKEIRALIAESAQQVTEGTQQMSAAGATIDAVVQSVQDVGDLIKRIGCTTREQAAGIAQVSNSLTQLDTVTHQNAALVHQSAASADQMEAGARALRRSVQVFRLP